MGNTTKTNSVEVEDKKKKPKIRNSSGESGFYSGEAGEPDCVLPKKSRSLKKRANIANAIAARFSTNRKPSMRGSSKKKLKKKNSLKSCEVLSDYDDDCEVSMVLPPQPTEELPKSLTMADFLVSCDNINVRLLKKEIFFPHFLFLKIFCFRLFCRKIMKSWSPQKSLNCWTIC